MDNKRGTAQSTLCVDNKNDKTELKGVTNIKKRIFFFFFWNFTNSASSRQFRDFSAIAENHWPYITASMSLIFVVISPKLPQSNHQWQ